MVKEFALHYSSRISGQRKYTLKLKNVSMFYENFQLIYSGYFVMEKYIFNFFPRNKF